MSIYLDINIKAFCAKLGLKIRALRLEKNLTQQQLADKAIISRTGVTQIEKGSYHATVFSVVKIAKVLETTVDKLVEEALSCN